LFPGSNKEEHRLYSLPNKVIVDTNVLLDAAFIYKGFSRTSISLLHDMGFKLICDKSIYGEAKKVLTDRQENLSVDYDPLIFLERLLSKYSFRTEETLQKEDLKLINNKDQHVAKAAIEHEAFILTNDCSLYDECKRSQISIRFTWHVLNEYHYKNDKVGIKDVIKIHKLGKNKGFIFSRIIPGDWDSSLNIESKFTIIDIENIGKLFYQSSRNKWIFQTKSGIELSFQFKFSRDEILTFLINYDLSKKRIEFRTCKSNHPVHKKIEFISNANSIGNINFGRDLNGKNFLNGHLSTIVTGHKNIGKENFKLFCKYVEGLPDPWDKGMLDFYMSKAMIIEKEEGVFLKYFIPNN
jgi:predicted nucleic acid-binding protein